ncbi:hypothetical protein [Amycolatopsis sp. NPDC004079]|uniref:hypothetical protein n=1 Tax=Amycolatopsis sp. NPDC004079 TaxID=3154549 RepID=UPI0033BEE0B8
MRLTIAVLGIELISVAWCRAEPDEGTEADHGAAGGQFELGFRPPRPTWSVLPGEEPG